MTTLRLILGDQLNPEHSWFAAPDDAVLYVLMEIRQETDYVLHHAQKIIAIFAAMRDFARQLRLAGHRVHYLAIDDPANRQSLAANLDALIADYSADAFDQELWAPCFPPPMQGDFLDYFLPEELAGFAGGKMPRLKVMEPADIDQVVSQFGAAAGRAKAAGFDAIEIHGGHGYLLSSFISPKTNTRTDEYGGSLENRAKVVLEIFRRVKAAVGEDAAQTARALGDQHAPVGKEG